MVDVEISENVCSGEPCGVHLAKKNRLEQCAVYGNSVAEVHGQPSSVLYGPDASKTTIDGFAADDNSVTVIQIQESHLSLSNASFRRNRIGTEIARGMKSPCFHLVGASAQIENCAFVANQGIEGAAVFAEKTILSVLDAVFDDNVGLGNGGSVYLANAKADFKRTAAINNSAKSDGGVVYASNSDVTFENTVAADNAGFNGGFLCMWMSNTKLVNTTATRNHAVDGGGFVFTRHSMVRLVTTNANSNRAESGGFLSTKYSTVNLDDTNAIRNGAQFGGFISAEQSSALLKHSNASGNGAEDKGGFIHARQSMITLEDLKATSGSSERGALLYARSSTLRIAQAHLSSSSSKTAGGFVAASDGSSISISDSTIVQGKSKGGGAIWLERSHATARNLTIARCEADGDGGGVMAKDASTFLCADCVLRDNSANEGNGGAVFFDVDPKQTLVLQLTRNRIENNAAKLGGKRLFWKSSFLLALASRRRFLRMRRKERRVPDKGHRLSVHGFDGHTPLG